jgi:hypothetical protein
MNAGGVALRDVPVQDAGDEPVDESPRNLRSDERAVNDRSDERVEGGVDVESGREFAGGDDALKQCALFWRCGPR